MDTQMKKVVFFTFFFGWKIGIERKKSAKIHVADSIAIAYKVCT